MTVRERIKEHRDNAGLRQVDVIARFAAAGTPITKQAYSAWENTGDTGSDPSPENLARFCEALGLSSADRLELYDLLAKHPDTQAVPTPESDQTPTAA